MIFSRLKLFRQLCSWVSQVWFCESCGAHDGDCNFFRDVTTSSVEEIYACLGRTSCSITFLRNVDKFLPDCTESVFSFSSATYKLLYKRELVVEICIETFWLFVYFISPTLTTLICVTAYCLTRPLLIIQMGRKKWARTKNIRVSGLNRTWLTILKPWEIQAKKHVVYHGAVMCCNVSYTSA
jgi:hypothetical protein